MATEEFEEVDFDYARELDAELEAEEEGEEEDVSEGFSSEEEFSEEEGPEERGTEDIIDILTKEAIEGLNEEEETLSEFQNDPEFRKKSKALRRALGEKGVAILSGREYRKLETSRRRAISAVDKLNYNKAKAQVVDITTQISKNTTHSNAFKEAQIKTALLKSLRTFEPVPSEYIDPKKDPDSIFALIESEGPVTSEDFKTQKESAIVTPYDIEKWGFTDKDLKSLRITVDEVKALKYNSEGVLLPVLSSKVKEGVTPATFHNKLVKLIASKFTKDDIAAQNFEGTIKEYANILLQRFILDNRPEEGIKEVSKDRPSTFFVGFREKKFIEPPPQRPIVQNAFSKQNLVKGGDIVVYNPAQDRLFITGLVVLSNKNVVEIAFSDGKSISIEKVFIDLFNIESKKPPSFITTTIKGVFVLGGKQIKLTPSKLGITPAVGAYVTIPVITKIEEKRFDMVGKILRFNPDSFVVIDISSNIYSVPNENFVRKIEKQVEQVEKKLEIKTLRESTVTSLMKKSIKSWLSNIYSRSILGGVDREVCVKRTFKTFEQFYESEFSKWVYKNVYPKIENNIDQTSLLGHAKEQFESETTDKLVEDFYITLNSHLGKDKILIKKDAPIKEWGDYQESTILEINEDAFKNISLFDILYIMDNDYFSMKPFEIFVYSNLKKDSFIKAEVKRVFLPKEEESEGVYTPLITPDEEDVSFVREKCVGEEIGGCTDEECKFCYPVISRVSRGKKKVVSQLTPVSRSVRKLLRETAKQDIEEAKALLFQKEIPEEVKSQLPKEYLYYLEKAKEVFSDDLSKVRLPAHLRWIKQYLEYEKEEEEEILEEEPEEAPTSLPLGVITGREVVKEIRPNIEEQKEYFISTHELLSAMNLEKRKSTLSVLEGPEVYERVMDENDIKKVSKKETVERLILTFGDVQSARSLLESMNINLIRKDITLLDLKESLEQDFSVLSPVERRILDYLRVVESPEDVNIQDKEAVLEFSKRRDEKLLETVGYENIMKFVEDVLEQEDLTKEFSLLSEEFYKYFIISFYTLITKLRKNPTREALDVITELIKVHVKREKTSSEIFGRRPVTEYMQKLASEYKLRVRSVSTIFREMYTNEVNKTFYEEIQSRSDEFSEAFLNTISLDQLKEKYKNTFKDECEGENTSQSLAYSIVSQYCDNTLAINEKLNLEDYLRCIVEPFMFMFVPSQLANKKPHEVGTSRYFTEKLKNGDFKLSSFVRVFIQKSPTETKTPGVETNPFFPEFFPEFVLNKYFIIRKQETDDPIFKHAIEDVHEALYNKRESMVNDIIKVILATSASIRIEQEPSTLDVERFNWGLYTRPVVDSCKLQTNTGYIQLVNEEGEPQFEKIGDKLLPKLAQIEDKDLIIRRDELGKYECHSKKILITAFASKDYTNPYTKERFDKPFIELITTRYKEFIDDPTIMVDPVSYVVREEAVVEANKLVEPVEEEEEPLEEEILYYLNSDTITNLAQYDRIVEANLDKEIVLLVYGTESLVSEEERNNILDLWKTLSESSIKAKMFKFTTKKRVYKKKVGPLSYSEVFKFLKMEFNVDILQKRLGVESINIRDGLPFFAIVKDKEITLFGKDKVDSLKEYLSQKVANKLRDIAKEEA